jgi:hypothetical protein
MELVLAAVISAIATAAVGALRVAWVDVRRHDLQVAERDQAIEEWIVIRDRQLKQRWNEIVQQARVQGVARGGTLSAARAAVQTQVLYDYREGLRDARNFVLRVAVEERLTHRLLRMVSRRPFSELSTPDRAAPLVEYWYEGAARDALTWSIDDIVKELPSRTPSRARASDSRAARPTPVPARAAGGAPGHPCSKWGTEYGSRGFMSCP